MLRDIKTYFSGVVAVPLDISMSGGTATIVKGLNDVRSPTSAAGGRASFTFNIPFSYNETSSGSNLDVCYIATTQHASANPTTKVSTMSRTTPVIDNQAGTDCTLNIVAVGMRNQMGGIFTMKQNAWCSRVDCRVISGKFDGSSTVNIGSGDFDITRSGAGVYNVTFRRPFAQTPTILVQAATNQRVAGITAKTASGCSVRTANLSNVASDSSFYIGVFGQDTTGDFGGREGYPMKGTQRKPILLPLTFISGTPATRGLGAQAVTTDLGSTGEIVAYFNKPFRREPCIFTTLISPAGTYFPTVTSSSSGGFSTVTTNAAAAPNDSSLSVLVIGSEDPNEY